MPYQSSAQRAFSQKWEIPKTMSLALAISAYSHKLSVLRSLDKETDAAIAMVLASTLLDIASAEGLTLAYHAWTKCWSKIGLISRMC
jgi:hypothetical protein